ncbi:hypothetical protein [Trinickia sp. EG282A]|uniref:hypothetical protein n=1 Tax=Trinickia sp. EG282A TaxID=3237013 RepID=UPI0034D24204
MSVLSREELDARLETIEARMDARVAIIEGQVAAFIARANERDLRLAEHQDRLTFMFEERDKRLAERDKRIEYLAEQATSAAQSASTLKANLWAATLTIIVSVAGMVMAAYHANQSSNLALMQTVISAFQHGQQTLPSNQ